MNPSNKPIFSLIASAIALGIAVSTIAWGQGYNEIFKGDGQVRPHYELVWKTYRSLSRSDRKEFLKGSSRDFKGDNQLLPIPRVLTAGEYQLLSRGVEQRGRALHAFLKDYYSVEKRFQKAKLIPASVLESILDRNNETTNQTTYVKHLNADHLEFWYGPDVIRDSEGQFRVVEDNTGFVGGMGDLVVARKSLLSRVPNYKKAIAPGHEPEVFYKDMIDHYKQEAHKFGGDVLLITYNNAAAADNEDKRISKLFLQQGVNTLKVSASGSVPKRDRYEVTQDGFYVDGQKIGLVVFDVESADLGPNGIEGFWDLYQRGLVGVVNPPGLEFINDKQFYVYVESLIRFYLNEEPILKNIDTKPFAKSGAKGRVALNQTLLKKTLSEPQKYVFKGANGRGGDQIWIGPKMTPKEIRDLRREIEANPTHYLVQKYTDLSELNGNIVDLRLLSSVSAQGSVIAPVPWGRATPIDGNGKVNISSNGKETTVIIVSETSDCEAVFEGPR